MKRAWRVALWSTYFFVGMACSIWIGWQLAELVEQYKPHPYAPLAVTLMMLAVALAIKENKR